MPTILDQIVETKWREIAAAKAAVPEARLERQMGTMPPARGFAAALSAPGPMHVIAEVKKASPSAGVIRADFDPVLIAETYERHGAACVSVLTDSDYFQGTLSDLSEVRRAVQLPLLRKDFILDRYQLLEARLAGADAALLIAEILPGDRLAELHRDAVACGLEVLVELHDAGELPRVLDSGATLVGVNNRDLRTFETRLDHTLDLMPRFPKGVTVVSESGIRTADDLARLAAGGVSAVLVGESLMRAADIGAALDALRGVTPPARPSPSR
jgi:indole-3-glycerol phosphate synthase